MLHYTTPCSFFLDSVNVTNSDLQPKTLQSIGLERAQMANSVSVIFAPFYWFLGSGASFYNLHACGVLLISGVHHKTQTGLPLTELEMAQTKKLDLTQSGNLLEQVQNWYRCALVCHIGVFLPLLNTRLPWVRKSKEALWPTLIPPFLPAVHTKLSSAVSAIEMPRTYNPPFPTGWNPTLKLLLWDFQNCCCLPRLS